MACRWKRTEIALFRCSLISPLLVDRPLEKGEICSHLEAVADQSLCIPFSERHTLHPDTISRYLFRYRKGGFEALKPRPRSDAGKSRRLPEAAIQKAIALREEVPSRSATTIVQILRRDPVVSHDLVLFPYTLRRILNEWGKSREKVAAGSKAFCCFEREEANALWQGDMLYGPYLPDVEKPGKYRRTALFCLIGKTYEHTKGIPRQINLVCTHALMAGCAQEKQVLD